MKATINYSSRKLTSSKRVLEKNSNEFIRFYTGGLKIFSDIPEPVEKMCHKQG